MPHLTDSSVGPILKKCKHLHSLYLANCKLLTGSCLMAAEPSTGLPIAFVTRIRNLDLSYCSSLHHEIVHFIGAGCVHLETLHICNFSSLKSEELESLSFSSRSHLIALDFNGWVDSSIAASFGGNDDGQKEDEGAQLLNGNRSDAPADETDESTVKSGKKKNSNNNNNNNDEENNNDNDDDNNDNDDISNIPLTPEAIALMSTNYKVLMTLKMAPSTPSASLTAKAFLPLFENLQSLTYLDISNNTKINETSFPSKPYQIFSQLLQLSDADDSSKNQQQLSSQQQHHHHNDESAYLYDHATIAPLQNPNLIHLFLRNLPHINDQSLKNISVAFPNLQTLEAPHSPLITESFPTHFKNLGLLNLSSSYQLNDSSVFTIANNNSHLQDLYLGSGPPQFDERINEENFSYSTQVTALSLEYLSRHCKKLSTLKLLNLSSFSSNPHAVHHFKFPHLLTLSLAHNEDLTVRILQQICQAAPNLLFLDVSNCPHIQVRRIGGYENGKQEKEKVMTHEYSLRESA